MLSLRLICGLLLTVYSSVSAIQNHTSFSCDSPIYCEGDILHTVQLAKIFSDSKTFVDMVSGRDTAESKKLYKCQKN